MTFYIYLFFSVIVVGCIFSINLFLETKKLKKKKKESNILNLEASNMQYLHQKQHVTLYPVMLNILKNKTHSTRTHFKRF